MTRIQTREEIVQALRATHRESVAWWSGLDTRRFVAPIGEAWSPADNVRHLTRAVRAVTKGLRMPRLVLRLLFGRARAPSRSFDEVAAVYDARLAAGGRATSAYIPRPADFAGDEEAWRARVMEYHALAIEELVQATSRWSERALDRGRLPHPLLGKLTVREMLFFTIHHNRHHVRVVQRRLGVPQL